MVYKKTVDLSDETEELLIPKRLDNTQHGCGSTTS
jgi:hypothetical protein